MIRTVRLPPHSAVRFTDDEKEADFVLTLARVTNFLAFQQRICQFPYEGGFVRKDLLCLTVRTHCIPDGNNPPCWWLPCFDLATEFHYFRQDYLQRLAREDENVWIVKPCTGTQARGHRIFCGDGIEGLEELARHVPRLSIEKSFDQNPGFVINSVKVDSIAQLFVTSPLCVSGRKFDIRVFVFVRSFEPFEGTKFNSVLFNDICNLIVVVCCSLLARGDVCSLGE